MRFAFTDDQLAFRDAVRDLLAKVAGPDTLRAVWDGDRGWDPAAWSHLAEMGVLGLLAPESAGGLALDEVDLVAVAVPALAAAGSPVPSGVPHRGDGAVRNAGWWGDGDDPRIGPWVRA